MGRKIKNRNRNKILLALDTSMLLAFMAATAPALGGPTLHEWIGVVCGVAVMAHLLLNWDWIVATLRRVMRSSNGQTRLSFALNLALFLDVTAILVSGLAISRAALPELAEWMPRSALWLPLHDLSAKVFLALVGLHLALHWDWLVTTLRRMAGGRKVTPVSGPRVDEGAAK